VDRSVWPARASRPDPWAMRERGGKRAEAEAPAAEEVQRSAQGDEATIVGTWTGWSTPTASRGKSAAGNPKPGQADDDGPGGA